MVGEADDRLFELFGRHLPVSDSDAYSGDEAPQAVFKLDERLYAV